MRLNTERTNFTLSSFRVDTIDFSRNDGNPMQSVSLTAIIIIVKQVTFVFVNIGQYHSLHSWSKNWGRAHILRSVMLSFFFFFLLFIVLLRRSPFSRASFFGDGNILENNPFLKNYSWHLPRLVKQRHLSPSEWTRRVEYAPPNLPRFTSSALLVAFKRGFCVLRSFLEPKSAYGFFHGTRSDKWFGSAPCCRVRSNGN